MKSCLAARLAKWFGGVTAASIVLGVGLAGVAAMPTAAMAVSTSIVISQVYGGGGNASATWRNDYVELFNLGNAPVSVNGWSVQYASAAGSSWAVTTLPNVSILPGGYLLVQEASGGAVGSLLPTADATGTTNMAAGAGKVALVSNVTALSGTCPGGASIIHLIGYGATANCFETSVASGPPNTTTSATRGANGCAETDNNSTDFAVVPAVPRNSASAPNPCGGGGGRPAAPIASSATSITPTSFQANGSAAMRRVTSSTSRPTRVSPVG